MDTKIVINPTYQAWAAFLHTLPMRFDAEGETLYADRNVIKRYYLNGKAVVVKRFRRPVWIQRMVYTFFRKSKAQRAYLYGLELRRRGVETAESIAYIEHKRLLLIDDCYYVCGNDSAPPIADEIYDTETPNLVMLADFARFVAYLHEHGILHHDLNRTNVLYHPLGNGHYTFSLIDNNRMRFYPEGTTPPLPECMENLTRFTGDMKVFRYVAEEYCKIRHLGDTAVETMIKVKEAHDARWIRRKRITHGLRFEV